MSFRRNQFSQITKEVSISSRKNIQEDMKDRQHDIQISLLQTTLNNVLNINTDQVNEINILKDRLQTLENRFNRCFPG